MPQTFQHSPISCSELHLMRKWSQRNINLQRSCCLSFRQTDPQDVFIILFESNSAQPGQPLHRSELYLSRDRNQRGFKLSPLSSNQRGTNKAWADQTARIPLSGEQRRRRKYLKRSTTYLWESVRLCCSKVQYSLAAWTFRLFWNNRAERGVKKSFCNLPCWVLWERSRTLNREGEKYAEKKRGVVKHQPVHSFQSLSTHLDFWVPASKAIFWMQKKTASCGGYQSLN